MPEYFLDKECHNQNYREDELNFKEFECCTFTKCDFSKCNFIDITFIDCIFNNCNFENAQVNHVALRTVRFMNCNISNVNFAMCNKLIFEVFFNGCKLDFSKFYTLKLKGTLFTNCSMIAVDFMATDLTEAIFDYCDLYRAEFDKALTNKTNFKTSFNYTIDPTKTKIKKAIFSNEGVKGLLFRHDLIIK